MADEAFENLINSGTETTAATSTEMGEAATTATGTTDTTLSTTEAAATSEMGEAATEVTQENIPAAPSVDYNEWLKTQSEGLFENVDTFKSSLEKFKGYDEKVNKISELEKNQLPDDQFVKQLAKMRADGASKDQLSQFVQLNTQYEDFSALSSEERMVAKLVLIDGYSKETAQRKVAREFDFSDLDEGSPEYLDLKEEQRIASNKDLEALNGYKAQISTVENQEEARRLESVALKSAHEQAVRQSIPNLLDKFTGIGSLDLDGKVGTEEVKTSLNFDFDEEYKQGIPAKLEAYFNQEIAPITPESIQEAGNYIKAEYLLNNYPRLLQEAYKTGLAKAAEITDNKYVNNKPLTEVTRETPSRTVEEQAQWKAFEESFAR